MGHHGQTHLAILAIAMFGSGPVAAQDISTVRIAGKIIDATTRSPVSGAVVRHLASSSVSVTGTTGRFSLNLEPAGAYVLQVEQLGYETSQAILPSTAHMETTTISIRPKPIELEGIQVTVASQFEERRVRSARYVEVLDEVAIAELGGFGVEMLRRALPLTRLCFDAEGRLCFAGGRGKVIVSICIDEMRAYGGSDDLSRYSPWDLHSIELFDSGRHVRVYTRAFIARVLSEGRRLRPLSWC